MKTGKCKICGNYEGKEKEIKRKKLSIDENIEIPIIHYWKWCKIHNNWCKNVAGNCGEVIEKSEKKIEGDINEII